MPFNTSSPNSKLGYAGSITRSPNWSTSSIGSAGSRSGSPALSSHQSQRQSGYSTTSTLFYPASPPPSPYVNRNLLRDAKNLDLYPSVFHHSKIYCHDCPPPTGRYFFRAQQPVDYRRRFGSSWSPNTPIGARSYGSSVGQESGFGSAGNTTNLSRGGRSFYGRCL